MAFYIYENWQAGPHKAVIHRGDCRYCNQGRGRRANTIRCTSSGMARLKRWPKLRRRPRSLPDVLVRHTDRCV